MLLEIGIVVIIIILIIFIIISLNSGQNQVKEFNDDNIIINDNKPELNNKNTIPVRLTNDPKIIKKRNRNKHSNNNCI